MQKHWEIKKFPNPTVNNGQVNDRFAVTMCVAFPMCIAANCSCFSVYCVIMCVSLLPHVYCFTVCGCIAVSYFSCRIKGKAIPLQAARSGPEGSRKIRFPDLMTTPKDGGKVVSLTHRPHLSQGNDPVTHFC